MGAGACGTDLGTPRCFLTGSLVENASPWWFRCVWLSGGLDLEVLRVVVDGLMIWWFEVWEMGCNGSFVG